MRAYLCVCMQMCYLGGLQVHSLKKELSTQLLQRIDLLLDQREVWRDEVKALLQIPQIICTSENSEKGKTFAIIFN